MRLLPRRTTHLLLAAGAAAGLIATNAGAAQAYTVECKTSSTGCISFSGYAGQPTWGFTVNTTGNNCVNYAAFRLARNGVVKPGNLGNGGDWGNRAAAMGYRVDRTPVAGSIAWWSYGSYYAPSNGHVAYVEEVTGSSITISESAWSGGSKRYRLTAGEANWPTRFIHFKDVGYQPPTSGNFIKVRDNGRIYKVVGRTPVFAPTLTPYGGAPATVATSAGSVSTLPTKIAEGAFVKGHLRADVFRVVGGAPLPIGSWAAVGGVKPVSTVDQAVIDRAMSSSSYTALNYSPSTSYLQAIDSSGTAFYYKLVGPTAYRFTSWTQVGGPKPYVRLGIAALNRAGGTGTWSHLKSVTTL
jgi:surface antigen